MLLAFAVATPATARDTIGIYRGWGAFRDAAPPRCYAIARPVMAGGRTTGFATIATWPKRGLRASLYIRLSRERDRSAGERRGHATFGAIGDIGCRWAPCEYVRSAREEASFEDPLAWSGARLEHARVPRWFDDA